MKSRKREIIEISNLAKRLKQLDLDIVNSIDLDSLFIIGKEKRQLTIKLITKCSQLSQL